MEVVGVFFYWFDHDYLIFYKDPFSCDFEETTCGWQTGDWFQRSTSRETDGKGPTGDFENNEDGKFHVEKGIYITLVPKVLYLHYLFVGLNTLDTFIEFWLVY